MFSRKNVRENYYWKKVSFQKWQFSSAISLQNLITF